MHSRQLVSEETPSEDTRSTEAEMPNPHAPEKQRRSAANRVSKNHYNFRVDHVYASID